MINNQTINVNINDFISFRLMTKKVWLLEFTEMG
jgi:hypothetical protein